MDQPDSLLVSWAKFFALGVTWVFGLSLSDWNHLASIVSLVIGSCYGLRLLYLSFRKKP